MKITITIIAIVFSLADAVMMWCLMRANALYERAETGLGGASGAVLPCCPDKQWQSEKVRRRVLLSLPYLRLSPTEQKRQVMPVS